MTRPAKQATSGVASTIEGGSCAFQRVKQIDSKWRFNKARRPWREYGSTSEVVVVCCRLLDGGSIKQLAQQAAGDFGGHVSRPATSAAIVSHNVSIGASRGT